MKKNKYKIYLFALFIIKKIVRSAVICGQFAMAMTNDVLACTRGNHV